MDTTTSLSPNEPGARIKWTEPTPGIIKIGGTLHIETATLLCQLLSQIITRQSQLPSELSENTAQIDLSDVDVCGTPGVQLLLSAQKTAVSKRISIHFVRPSLAVEDAFCRFGIEGLVHKNSQSGDLTQ